MRFAIVTTVQVLCLLVFCGIPAIDAHVLVAWTTDDVTSAELGPQTGALRQTSTTIADYSHRWPVADACALSNFQAIPYYFDSTATVCIQKFDSTTDFTPPFAPSGMVFSLYWASAGSDTDRVTVSSSVLCDNPVDSCCAPHAVLCSRNDVIQRSTGMANEIVVVSLAFDSATCCVAQSFWIGCSIMRSGPTDPGPSLLFTRASEEPNGVPECQQWIEQAGEFVRFPNGDLGWWDLRLFGDCDTCGSEIDSCPEFSQETLLCNLATPIACVAEGITLVNETNALGSSTVTKYCCAPWGATGPESIYLISLAYTGHLYVRLSDVAGGEVDLYLLSGCSPYSCVSAAGDSLHAENLEPGVYFLVVDGRDGGVASFDLFIQCYSNCAGTECSNDIEFGHPVGNLYLDGEWCAADSEHVYYSYYPGSGNRQTILKFSRNECSLVDTTGWTSADATACRGFAFDPRNGGQFWTGTVTNWSVGTGKLYRVGSGGSVLNTFSSIAGLTNMRWSGFAFDESDNHLWIFTRRATISGSDFAWELDVTNPSVPVLIQGPHLLGYINPNTIISSGGADYSSVSRRILLGVQTEPEDAVECLIDVDPAYAGPPPGPGLSSVSFCIPDSNAVQGFGVVAIDNGGIQGRGEMLMLDFTDVHPGFPPHKLFSYPVPCELNPTSCDSVMFLTIRTLGTQLQFAFFAPQTADYVLYGTADLNATSPPPTAPWTAMDSLFLPAGPAILFVDLPADVLQMYSVIARCP